MPYPSGGAYAIYIIYLNYIVINVLFFNIMRECLQKSEYIKVAKLDAWQAGDTRS